MKSHIVGNYGKEHELLPRLPSNSHPVSDSSIDVRLHKLATDKTMKTDKSRDDKRKIAVNIRSHYYLLAAR